MLISFPNHPLASLTGRNPNFREQSPLFHQFPNVHSRPLFAPTRKSSSIVRALITSPDDFEVGRFVGSYGFMNVTSYSSFQAGGFSSANTYEKSLGYSSEDIERLRVQDVGEGQVKISLIAGSMREE